MFKFERLIAWQQSIELFEEIAEIADAIPNSYQSSVSDQIRRSCLSISANIAEATGRESSKERKYYFNVAKGSFYETVSLLHIIKSRQHINDHIFSSLYRKCDEIAKMLYGLSSN
ncbi:MAG: four helix bundle protein [Nitrospirota bacterium]